mmetsp:Transcript_91332/g.244556  ORF Transcript_91332/g.244556 Transcript_91332/m.244556 type:complete len:402 (+) Transcript_91332:42-1247(+)
MRYVDCATDGSRSSLWAMVERSDTAAERFEHAARIKRQVVERIREWLDSSGLAALSVGAGADLPELGRPVRKAAEEIVAAVGARADADAAHARALEAIKVTPNAPGPEGSALRATNDAMAAVVSQAQTASDRAARLRRQAAKLADVAWQLERMEGQAAEHVQSLEARRATLIGSLAAFEATVNKASSTSAARDLRAAGPDCDTFLGGLQLLRSLSEGRRQVFEQQQQLDHVVRMHAALRDLVSRRCSDFPPAILGGALPDQPVAVPEEADAVPVPEAVCSGVAMEILGECVVKQGSLMWESQLVWLVLTIDAFLHVWSGGADTVCSSAPTTSMDLASAAVELTLTPTGRTTGFTVETRRCGSLLSLQYWRGVSHSFVCEDYREWMASIQLALQMVPVVAPA